jgi:LmbE family N-acetylglucosaminyl deacetylase
VATIVFFHAHPDDESITTAGVMARMADEGHRVVLVVATKGEVGEVPDEFLAPGATLAEWRVKETMAAADILGVARVEFLGYVDSGMAGAATNDADGAFARADVDEAAGRLRVLLDDERADVVTTYDDIGLYGHPDHVMVHHVGRRAAELAGTPRVFEATMNRDDIRRGAEMARAAAADDDSLRQFAEIMAEVELDENFAVPEAELTTAVDVRPWLARKRAAMAAHASQIPSDSWFLTIPPELFAMAFGTEWFIHVGVEPGLRETSLLD